jgi:hypothetical protein
MLPHPYLDFDLEPPPARSMEGQGTIRRKCRKCAFAQREGSMSVMAISQQLTP